MGMRSQLAASFHAQFMHESTYSLQKDGGVRINTEIDHYSGCTKYSMQKADVT